MEEWVVVLQNNPSYSYHVVTPPDSFVHRRSFVWKAMSMFIQIAFIGAKKLV